jgi:hypothetical protein
MIAVAPLSFGPIGWPGDAALARVLSDNPARVAPTALPIAVRLVIFATALPRFIVP